MKHQQHFWCILKLKHFVQTFWTLDFLFKRCRLKPGEYYHARKSPYRRRALWRALKTTYSCPRNPVVTKRLRLITFKIWSNAKSKVLNPMLVSNAKVNELFWNRSTKSWSEMSEKDKANTGIPAPVSWTKPEIKKKKVLKYSKLQ